MRLASIPPFQRLFCATLLGAAVGLTGLSGGCGEVITYAGEARQQGIKLYNEGHYPEAAGSFANAIKQRPQDYESYYYLGRTHEAQGNYHKAVSEYRTSLSLMTNSLRGRDDVEFRQKAVAGLASAISAGKDITLEQAAFHSTNGPATAEDFYVVAKVRRNEGDVDSALTEYAKAASMDPKSLVIAKEYGLYLVELNKRSEASTELRRAYALNYRKRLPEDAEINKGLRTLNIIPGPSLADERDLRQPIIPPGPLPEIKLNNGGTAASTD